MKSLEEMAFEAGAQVEFIGGGDEPTRSGIIFETVEVRKNGRLVDSNPSLERFADMVRAETTNAMLKSMGVKATVIPAPPGEFENKGQG